MVGLLIEDARGVPELGGTRTGPRGPLNTSFSRIVERSCRRVGIRPFGPRRPRHAVPWHLLTDGVSLTEIGQLLATAASAPPRSTPRPNVEAVRPCLPQAVSGATVDRWPERMGLFLA